MYRTKDGLVFRTKPWKHQISALRYLKQPEHSSAALLLKMGAGKTKIWIDLINNMDFDTTLIVCPAKATRVWVKQFPEHSVDQSILVINLFKYSGKEKVAIVKKTLKDRQTGQKLVFIINYDSIWRQPFRSFIKDKVKLDAIICDESHRIKSPSSKVSKFLQVLGRRCDHRYIATGTLLAQTPLDVYAQYRFLNPDVFGTNYETFCSRYTKVDAYKTAKFGYTVLDKDEPYVNLDDMRERIMSCAFSVDAELDLPPTRDIIVEFDLPPKLQSMYDTIRKEGVLELNSGFMEINNALSLVLRLQQLTSGFMKVEDDYGNKSIELVDNSRMKALEDLLIDFPKDEPIVIFARFKQDILNIRKVCKNLNLRCSEISGRCDEYDDWEAGKTSILIVQLQSGAEGLDFTKARYAVYYTLTHTLWQYTQSRKRLHRPGQENPVTYYFLLGKLATRQSVDEGIMSSLKRNANFIQEVMEEKEKVI